MFQFCEGAPQKPKHGLLKLLTSENYMKEEVQLLSKYKPASTNFEFRQFPFYWLMRVANAYSLRMEKSLRKAQINTTAWRIMLILREQGALSVSEIATHAVAKMPTITKSTYKMQTDGLVDIKTSDKDGRVSIVMLTEKGATAASEIIKSTERVFEHIYDNVSVDEIEVFNAMLQKFFLNLDAN